MLNSGTIVRPEISGYCSLCGVVMECDCDGNVTKSGTCITIVFYRTMMVIVFITHILYVHLHSSCVDFVKQLSLVHWTSFS